MGKMVAGALLASLAWGAAWWLLLAPDNLETLPCDERCGEGTRCEEELCIVDAVEAPQEEPTTKKKGRGKRRRRGKRGAGSPSGDTGDLPEAGAPRVDDSHIPAFSNGPQALDLNGGSERLTDAQVRGVVRKLTPKFQRCIGDAATGDTPLRGEVKITARVNGDGKASQVSATAPAAIRESHAIPCIRKAVFDQRFPTYDGPSMGVDLSFEVD